MLIRPGDALQFGDVADVDDRRQLRVLFGYPQTDIGPAGEDCGVRARGERLSKFRDRARRNVSRTRGRQALLAGDANRQQLFLELALACRVEVIRILVHASRRGQDRSITRAAAQIARQGVTHGVIAGIAVGLVKREERHDETRRTEAALRAVALHQRPLHRVQSAAIGRFEALDGEEGLAVQSREKPDAGIDRPILDFVSCKLGQNDRTRAAVTLGATFLRATAAQVIAQVLQHGGRRIEVLGGVDLAIHQEADRVLAGQINL